MKKQQLEDSDVCFGSEIIKIKGNVSVGDQEANVWSMVSPVKISRLSLVSALKDDEVQISASKFSVLNVDVEEEGEIVVEH